MHMSCFKIMTVFMLTMVFPIMRAETYNINSQGPLSGPTVNTKYGQVIGKTEIVENKNVHSFLGIPFATPPLGDLRFKRTVPLQTSWYNNPLLAQNMPPACSQYQDEPIPWYDFQPGKSEDCLYLNIWTPEMFPNQRKAVMVWIYGGGYQMGSNRQYKYDGRVLSSFGDVVVVTINYRLAVLGFLYSRSNDAPGNAGLYDILEALKWVNENIAAFGGDEENITLFGESVGGITTSIFMVSPLTRHLFKRAILESGAVVSTYVDNTVEKNFNQTDKLAKVVGCKSEGMSIRTHPKEIVDCLRKIPASQLQEVDVKLQLPLEPMFLPVQGDLILPTNVRKAIKAGNIKECDVLIGNNHDEGSIIMTLKNPDYFGYFGHKNPPVNKTKGKSILQKEFKEPEWLENVVNFYYGEVSDEDCNEIRQRTYRAFGDYEVRCPSIYFAEKTAERSRTYYYDFNRRPTPTQNAEWMGVSHFEEVYFVFGNPFLEQTRALYSDEERALSQNMILAWSDFAKTGNPCQSSRCWWPLYSKDLPFYAILDKPDTFDVRYGPNKQNCDFFRPYFGF